MTRPDERVNDLNRRLKRLNRYSRTPPPAEAAAVFGAFAAGLRRLLAGEAGRLEPGGGERR